MIHIKLTIMSLLWAGGFISAKMVVPYAGPFTISFLRFLIATIVLAVCVGRSKNHTRLDWSLFTTALTAAFLGVFCYNYLFYSGMVLIEASRASVIVGTVPVAVTIISWIIFRESISWMRILGIVTSFLGACVVITKGELGTILQQGVGWGEVMMVGCVLCAAGYALFSKVLLKKLSPLSVMLYVASLGSIFLLGPALLELRSSPMQWQSVSFICNMLYLSVGHQL